MSLLCIVQSLAPWGMRAGLMPELLGQCQDIISVIMEGQVLVSTDDTVCGCMGLLGGVALTQGYRTFAVVMRATPCRDLKGFHH